MTAKKGELVAVLDAGEAGGSGIHIGNLVLDRVELGEVKIPAGLTAVLRRSQGEPPRVLLETSASIRYAAADGAEMKKVIDLQRQAAGDTRGQTITVTDSGEGN